VSAIATDSQPLYDNASRPEYASLRRLRLRRVAVSLVVFISILIVIAVVAFAPALYTGGLDRVVFWLAASAFPFVVIIGGLIDEAQHPLDIRVDTTGVTLRRRHHVPVSRLRGARLTETDGFIILRQVQGHRRRPILGIWKRDLANPEAFRLALSLLVAAEPSQGNGDVSNQQDQPVRV
jgi:hypothetical protein